MSENSVIARCRIVSRYAIPIKTIIIYNLRTEQDLHRIQPFKRECLGESDCLSSDVLRT